MIEFKPANITEEYFKEWNCISNDINQIYLNDKLVSKNIYRKNAISNWKDGYLTLNKLVEDYYNDTITNNPKRKKYLKYVNCIIDENGIEKVELKDSFKYINHIGGIVYSVANSYYNIETKELYCKTYSPSLKSKDFIFLDNNYDEDKSKRGVWKINLHTGEYEIFRK
jgi:hypothetical protein